MIFVALLVDTAFNFVVFVVAVVFFSSRFSDHDYCHRCFHLCNRTRLVINLAFARRLCEFHRVSFHWMDDLWPFPYSKTLSKLTIDFWSLSVTDRQTYPSITIWGGGSNEEKNAPNQITSKIHEVVA